MRQDGADQISAEHSEAAGDTAAFALPPRKLLPIVKLIARCVSRRHVPPLQAPAVARKSPRQACARARMVCNADPHGPGEARHSLVPVVRVTGVLPQVRCLKLLGALMSYHSFFVKGSMLRKGAGS